MKKVFFLVWMVLTTLPLMAIVEGRWSLSLNGGGWNLWLDHSATWQHDRLYLPEEATDLSLLPVNAPTGGWEVLTDRSDVRPVCVPGTVEEYCTTSDTPQPGDFRGVSWWWRTLRVPAEMKGRRIRLHFESVRMRAEVYLDGRLVAYDIIGESPFEADITDAVVWGKEQTLAVRVTNPGGNFHWQDFTRQKWGTYDIPPARAFGGIIGRVHLDAVSPVHITDVYMQNTPVPTTVNAVVEFWNPEKKPGNYDVEYLVTEKSNPSRVVLRQQRSRVTLAPGMNTLTQKLQVPDARLWDFDSPALYTCRVVLKRGRKVMDDDGRTFGFRWFAPDGIGREAVLRLNGRRVMLRSAISWGYFPVTGLYATREMAVKQVNTAKDLGLNMLNFHRSIGSPVVLEVADSLGLGYLEEPGAFHSAGHDPFIRALVNTKLQRMVRRDRSHPSLLIYNLINEYGGPLAQDTALVAKRMNDMRLAHAIDPSRVMTFTSGWALTEDQEEDPKAHLRPFDTTLYRRGWFDNHRAGGPATYMQSYYVSPEDNLMFTDNHTEVYMRGEEGAISTPPRLALIHAELERTGKTGWDGLFWEKQYREMQEFFDRKGLASGFGTLDNLTRQMGNVQLEHQGRRIESMRMQDIGDIYVVNGWESMPYDNHSGIVDLYRNPKGDTQVLARYNRPLYVAVAPRMQIVKSPDNPSVDFYLVNEKGLKGGYMLQVYDCRPDGTRVLLKEVPAEVKGGDVFGQQLLTDYAVDLDGQPGMHRIEAELRDAAREVVATGYDEVLSIDWSAADLQGQGAVYGNPGDAVSQFYEQVTGRPLQPFTPDCGKLDWLVVNRSSLNAPEPVPAEYFRNKDGHSTVHVTWCSDLDIQMQAGVSDDVEMNRSFGDGAQPSEFIPANQPFSAVWEGELMPTESGMHLVGVESDQGIRLDIDGVRMVDDYWNQNLMNEARPVMMEAGKPVKITLAYYQHTNGGKFRLTWSRPQGSEVSVKDVLDRACNDGTTVVVLGSAETWMEGIAKATGSVYRGFYTVGRDWIGGIHFVKAHPLFSGLPVNTSMNWPYQQVVRDGDNRYGFNFEGGELVAGSYRSTPFHLGTAVGVVPYGKGKIIFSSLDIVGNLLNSDSAAETARKLFCNFVGYHE